MSLVLRITPFALLVLAAGCAAPPMGPTVQVMPGPGKSFDAFQNESALDPLRDRTDFRLLMMDLAMPAEPFAAAR